MTGGKKSKRVQKIDQFDSNVKCFHFTHIFQFRAILVVDILLPSLCRKLYNPCIPHSPA